MVDRVYKAGIPQLRKDLARLKKEFSVLDSGTDWTKLRIDPLLRHVEALEGLLSQRDFAKEYSRLRRGVVMFHSDLVYLRDNVKALERTLESEKKHKETVRLPSPVDRSREDSNPLWVRTPLRPIGGLP